MSGRDGRCWWCGQFAPAGVCVRPHPTYDRRTERARRYVQTSGEHILPSIDPVQAPDPPAPDRTCWVLVEPSSK